MVNLSQIEGKQTYKMTWDQTCLFFNNNNTRQIEKSKVYDKRLQKLGQLAME